jgi:glycosyltransferase involved in cell wall biosynthesis
MENPRVSVVIATYNRGDRIARTLDSVLAQTTPAGEILVIDDGSTDDTASWIRRQYPQVRVLTYQNGGTSIARSRGAQQASERVLMFLDHDDTIFPHAIETLIGLLTAFPEARAAFADHELRNLVDQEFFPNHHATIPSFQRMRSIRVLSQHSQGRTYARDMYYALLRGNLLQQPWAIYRDDFLSLGGYDPKIRYCEDWEMYIRVTSRVVVAVTDRVISTHFIEGQNLHRAAGQEIEHMKVLRKHLRLIPLTDWRAMSILRSRLAQYYKDVGDHRRAAHQPGAWGAYVRSLVTWPFDIIVAIRCLLWSPSGIWEGARRSLRWD